MRPCAVCIPLRRNKPAVVGALFVYVCCSRVHRREMMMMEMKKKKKKKFRRPPIPVPDCQLPPCSALVTLDSGTLAGKSKTNNVTDTTRVSGGGDSRFLIFQSEGSIILSVDYSRFEREGCFQKIDGQIDCMSYDNFKKKTHCGVRRAAPLIFLRGAHRQRTYVGALES